jgi:hypothetical protein
MTYKAQVVLNIEFPEAETLEQAQTTLDIWFDLIAPILADKVSWPEIEGTPVYEDEEE